MPHVITRRSRLSRRIFLKGLSLTQAPVVVGLPPLIAMFNSSGTAYAAGTGAVKSAPVEERFVLWFNGNGIPERYWIPSRTGMEYDMTPCLMPLARLRDDVLVLSGLDNSGPGGPVVNGHHTSMSALMSCTHYTGRGPGGPSFDQYVARRLGGNSRFRSMQIGVSQESFGDAMHKNMSWAGPDRPLPPEEIPHRLFDRLFGGQDEGWINRKRSILDAVRQDAALLRRNLPKEDELRLDEHLSSIRDLERAITSLPPEHRDMAKPEEDFDMKDWPRVARLQSDMLAYALATRQTRVASYMLTKCQGLSRFPWLGHTSARHHDYTHKMDGKSPSSGSAAGQRILSDICRWHVEEFAYLVAKLKSIPEGEGTLLDKTVLVFVHEHAEAGAHKNSGMIALVAGCKNKLALGRHARIAGTIGDLYLTVADDVLGAGLGKFPTASRRLTGILA
ncbi:MAG: DUF1552 domain-containing protein [Acidobacteria bacterium]|nr:DUF1552 domain-containing protein [Acidobacteriota bacterium]